MNPLVFNYLFSIQRAFLLSQARATQGPFLEWNGPEGVSKKSRKGPMIQGPAAAAARQKNLRDAGCHLVSFLFLATPQLQPGLSRFPPASCRSHFT
jgi:hypothetical protein